MLLPYVEDSWSALTSFEYKFEIFGKGNERKGNPSWTVHEPLVAAAITCSTSSWTSFEYTERATSGSERQRGRMFAVASVPRGRFGPTTQQLDPWEQSREFCPRPGRLQLLRHSSSKCLRGRVRLVRREEGGGGLQVEDLEGSSCWSRLQDTSHKCKVL